MKINKLFNSTIILFCALVPLFSMKTKIGPIPVSADFILGSIIIFCGLIMMLNNGQKKDLAWILKDRKLKILTILAAAFSIIAFLSVLYARNKGAVITEGLRFLEYVFLFYLILGFTDNDTIKKSLKVFYVVMIIASCYGVVQYIFNLPDLSSHILFSAGGFWGRGRVSATFANPNYWGAAVNLVIFYPIVNIIEKRNIRVNIPIFLLFFFNMFFTSTRGSWIGFGLGLLAMGFIRYKKLVGISIALFLSMFILPITRARFLQMLNINERMKLYRTGLLMFRDNVLKGVGNGNYIFEYKHYVYWHKELFLGRDKFSIHNSYLKMFVELGVFGGILFVSIYVLLFKIISDIYKETKENKQWTLSFLCFGFSYLIQNLSNNLMFIPQLNVFVWLISALLIKGVYLQNKDYFNHN